MLVEKSMYFCYNMLTKVTNKYRGLIMAASKIQTGLRLDEVTYGKLKTISETESRSLNNLVEYIIKAYLSDYEKQNGSVLSSPYQDN